MAESYPYLAEKNLCMERNGQALTCLAGWPGGSSSSSGSTCTTSQVREDMSISSRFLAVTEREGLPHPSLRWAAARPPAVPGLDRLDPRWSGPAPPAPVNLGGLGGMQK